MEFDKTAHSKINKIEIIGRNYKANPPIIELQYTSNNSDSAEIKFHYIKLATCLDTYKSVDNIVNYIFDKNKLFLDRNKTSEVEEVINIYLIV